MGAYLSQPKTEKLSTDELNNYLIVGASSMQGWRNSQEDAHNAILDFGKDTAFFAVYDGHGGAEVSTYCADKLPAFLQALDAYKDGNFEQALKDAFLGFDKMLLEPAVIEVLKALAGEKNFVDGDDSDALEDDEDENLAELHEEGSLPLDEVLEKYKGHPSMPTLKKLKESAGGCKPQSPFLRGRRAAAVIADAANRAVLDPDSKPEGSSTSKAALAAQQEDGPSSSKSSSATKMEAEEDSTVSSSSSSASKSNTKNSTSNMAAEAEPSSSKTSNGNTTTTTSPDSSAVKENEQNGSVSSSEAKPVAKSKPTAADGHLAGSSDATLDKEPKQNGNVESSTKSPSKKEASNAAAITSTSKDQQKDKKNANFADDSEDEDDMDANESNARQALEYSSEEDDEADLGEDGSTEEEDADYDDDEVDDEDEDGEDEEEDEESYLANEQFCANMIEEPGKDSGCTAVVALLCGRDLYVANAGDSRCVVCRNGKAIEMSLDHKPEDDEESARIVKAGGRVTLDGRVNGGLNLSRALGDHAYKMTYGLPAEEQMISALPDIKKLIISPDDEFMVLACDGIWNFMTSEEVVDFVRLRLKDENKKMSEICEELFDACLAPNTLGDGTGCDNMTAVIVRFKPTILELPTKIDPNETEDVLLAKQKEAADSPEQKAQKRAASPTSDDNSNEAENKTKRLKTDSAKGDAANAEANTTTASSSIPATNSVDDTTTSTTSKTTSGNSSTQECDSGADSNEAQKNESASSVVSST